MNNEYNQSEETLPMQIQAKINGMGMNILSALIKLEEYEKAEGMLERQQWTSIDERLPEPLTLSLACIQGIENSVIIAVFSGKKWFHRNQEVVVTHWMPLPEPPKE